MLLLLLLAVLGVMEWSALIHHQSVIQLPLEQIQLILRRLVSLKGTDSYVCMYV